ncbi:hypothetical protein BESB_008280 [Besnoitia besnoiti]|uniref:Uncharacterized protein n=1 Tax=Besnoitia besnoiti TaxID=94643 RepID=A0A2A9MPZ4_BESBE|nr:hypothetical protein BESB_008280 [Besnoitia besnoiti]PFH38486.1 hypothetical protein BESB_008280 [Besnoitia besnoiti]
MRGGRRCPVASRLGAFEEQVQALLPNDVGSCRPSCFLSSATNLSPICLFEKHSHVHSVLRFRASSVPSYSCDSTATISLPPASSAPATSPRASSVPLCASVSPCPPSAASSPHPPLCSRLYGTASPTHRSKRAVFPDIARSLMASSSDSTSSATPPLESAPPVSSSEPEALQAPPFVLRFLPSTVGRDRLRRQSERISTRAALVRRASRLSHANLALALHQLSLDASASAQAAAVSAVLRARATETQARPMRPNCSSSVSPSPAQSSRNSAESNPERPGHTSNAPPGGRGDERSPARADAACKNKQRQDKATQADAALEVVRVWGELKDLNREEETTLWVALLDRLEEIEGSVTPTEHVVILDALCRLPPHLLSTPANSADASSPLHDASSSASSPAPFASSTASPAPPFGDRVRSAAYRAMQQLERHVTGLPATALAVILRAAAVLDVRHLPLLNRIGLALGGPHCAATPTEEAQRSGNGRRDGGVRESGNGDTASGGTAEEDTTDARNPSSANRQLGGRGICAVVYAHLALRPAFPLDAGTFLQQFLSSRICMSLSPTHAAALATYGRLLLEESLLSTHPLREQPIAACSSSASPSSLAPLGSIRFSAATGDSPDRATSDREASQDRNLLLLCCSLEPLVRRLLQIQCHRSPASHDSSRSPAVSASGLMGLATLSRAASPLFSSLLSLQPEALSRPYYSRLDLMRGEASEDRKREPTDSSVRTSNPYGSPFCASLFSPQEEAAAAAFCCVYLAALRRLRLLPKNCRGVSSPFEGVTGAVQNETLSALREEVARREGSVTPGSVGRQRGYPSGETKPARRELSESRREQEACGRRGWVAQVEKESERDARDENGWPWAPGGECSVAFHRGFAEALPTLLGWITGAEAAALFSGLQRLGALDAWTAEALVDVMERELGRASPTTQRHASPWGERRPGLPFFWNEERLGRPVLLHDALQVLEVARDRGTRPSAALLMFGFPPSEDLCRRTELLHTLGGKASELRGLLVSCATGAGNLAQESASLSATQRTRLTEVLKALGVPHELAKGPAHGAVEQR